MLSSSTLTRITLLPLDHAPIASIQPQPIQVPDKWPSQALSSMIL